MPASYTLQASEHPIKSVTVFKSSKAEVVRTFTLNLKKGQNKIEIRGLPSTIDTHSVRVSGLGDARLFDIVCTIAKSKSTAGVFTPDSSEAVRGLTVKRQAIESEKAVREQESQLLFKYAQTLSGEHVSPVQMGHFLESFVEQGRKNAEARTELGEKLIQLDREIEAEKEKTASKKGSALGQVDIVIVADDNDSVDLKLTYIVSNAQWNPTYELHATTENGKPSSSVSLHYRARVSQSTGEDWNNTALTLSTVASDTVVKQIPQLRRVRIQPAQFMRTCGQKGGLFSNFSNVNNNPGGVGLFGGSSNMQKPAIVPQAHSGFGGFGAQHGLFGAAPSGATGVNAFNYTLASAPQQQQQQQQTSLFGQATSAFGAAAPQVMVDHQLMQAYERELSAAEPAPLPEEDDFEEVDGRSAITEPTTVVSETPMAISFTVHGESTIPSDEVDHQVSVALLPFKAKISYITIPRIDPRVFLQCEVENSSEYRLLPGHVTVILDDSYVSKTSINDINTGDTFECTLGDDSSTKVTYLRSSKTVKSTGGSFSEVTNTTTYTTKISIHNKHQFAITDLIVREVIPTCEDKRAKIVLRKPLALADAKDGQVVDLENDSLKVGWEKLVDGKGGEKDGKFEWKWKVGNGAKVNLEAEWEVKAPGDVPWVEASPLFS